MSTEHQERRRRQRLCFKFKRLRRRADAICGPVTEAHDLLGDITDLARDVHQLLGESETATWLGQDVRGGLEQAISGLQRVSEVTKIPADVCDRLDTAFENTELALESWIPPSPRPWNPKSAWFKALIGGGVTVAGVAIAVILTNSTTVNLQNVNCGEVNFGGSVVSLIPGGELSDTIQPGETVSIQLPKAFVGRVAVISETRLAIQAFGQEFAFRPGSLELDASSWDDSSLADLVGQQVSVSGEHNLVLRC